VTGATIKPASAVDRLSLTLAVTTRVRVAWCPLPQPRRPHSCPRRKKIWEPGL